MALSPWTLELMRRGLADVTRRAGETDALERLRTRAARAWQDLPDAAARNLDRVMRNAEEGKTSVGRWARRRTALATTMLNASGVLMNEFGTGVPLAGEVLAAGQEAAAGDVLGGDEAAERLARRLGRALSSERDDQLAVTSSFPAALAALAAFSGARRLVVHRHHAVRLSDGVPLPEALRNFSPVIQEVGAVDRVDASDFDDSAPFCAVLADDGHREVQLLDLSSLQHGAQAVILPLGTAVTHDRAALLAGEIPSAQRLLAAGADLVVMPGHGLSGGPECGLLIGSRELVQSIVRSARWPSLAASMPVQAMMTAALEKANSPQQQLPIEQLLSAGEGNLQGRAERLAMRLSGNEAIVHCEVTGDAARLTGSGRWRLPSRQLALKHRSLSGDQWREKLRGELPAVIAAGDAQTLKIDLRWISPAEDGKLGELLETSSGSVTAESEQLGPGPTA